MDVPPSFYGGCQYVKKGREKDRKKEGKRN
jgi:hypothetical protein